MADDMLEDYFTDEFKESYLQLEDEPEYEAGEFFCENLMKARASVSAEQFRRFSGLDGNGARVGFLMSLPATHELPIMADYNYDTKSASRARSLKASGNTAFGLGHYEVAIDEYNDAAVLAPTNEELAVILANRSAALYHLERYQVALGDCDEALRTGYPGQLLYKLEERRARCLLALKRHLEAVDSFKRAIRALDDARELAPDKKAKLEADMRVMLAVLLKGEQLSQRSGPTRQQLLHMEKKRAEERDATPRMRERNPVYPACSKAVEVRDAGGDVGRYAVATRDIRPGEILVVERPHCATILAEKRLTHCHWCTVRISAAYPAGCGVCTWVAYCSTGCRDADARVHEFECGILGPLWSTNTSVTCVLALRAVIQQPFADFVELRVDELRGRAKPSRARPYLASDYGTFYNLVTHESERTAEDLFHRAYMAGWLLRVLKTTSYVPDALKTPDTADQPLSGPEVLIADAILHHIQLLQFNSHEISEFVRPRKRPHLTNGRSEFVGGGVYPTVALFNHSCNPGVVRYFVGNAMVVRAIRSIPAGGEISENYGPIFTAEEESERKRHLRLQYWFDCNCEACRDHWPLLGNIDANILRFKCDTGPSCGNVLLVDASTDSFMISCSKCGKSTNILKGLKAIQDTDSLYKAAKRHLQDNKPEEASKSYVEVLKVLDESLALPIKDYHLCQQHLRTCMLALGNAAIEKF
ncbi:SET and MYND domain-containing protein 4 [Copidosoma floridanum]|uniref:SET and MYND domain-containing protein 4 n=1 Tax=Copidosoma floridanum TaxID=29053 RepID=UPI0006C99B10|nr:SET and MYND domain-containing protein 4 [Copidosoma floridanum]